MPKKKTTQQTKDPEGNNKPEEKEEQLKGYPLKMPYDLWHQTRLHAMSKPMTLGKYILEAIAEKNEREAKKQ